MFAVTLLLEVSNPQTESISSLLSKAPQVGSSKLLSTEFLFNQLYDVTEQSRLPCEKLRAQ